MTVVAVFTAKKYQLTVVADPSVGGSVSTTGGSYNYNTYLTVRATTNTGYNFLGWYNGSTRVSSNTSYSFYLRSNMTLTAKFAAKANYIVSVAADPTAGGTVSGGGSYTEGTSATVRATANSHYTFDGWYNGSSRVSYNSSYTFTVNSNITLTAKLTPEQYSIKVSSSSTSYGTVSGGGTYGYGESCTVVATPRSSSYEFVSWKEGNTVVSTDASYTFVVSGARTLTATFQVAPTRYTVTLQENTTGSATLIGAGKYVKDSSCTIEAVLNSGYTFQYWKKQTSSGGSYVYDNPSTFKVTQDTTFTLYARKTNNPVITVVASPATGGTVSGGGTYSEGDTVTLTAKANAGYVFDGWLLNGGWISSDATYTFSAYSSEEYTAVFKAPTSKWVKAVQTGYATGGLVFGNGKFVGVASNSACYSTDADRYSYVNLPGSAARTPMIAFGGGKFVIAGKGEPTNEVYYSTDGVNWSTATLPVTAYWSGIAYGNDKFILTNEQDSAYSPSKFVLYSTNGVNWYSASLPTSYGVSVAAVFYGNKFLAFGTLDDGRYTGVCLYSTNGTSWSYTTNLPFSITDYMFAAYGNNRWVLHIGGGGTTYYHSTDGTTWTEAEMPYQITENGTPYYCGYGPMAFGNGKFLAVPHGNATQRDFTSTSTDGLTWAGSALDSQDPLSGFQYLAYGNGRWGAIRSDSMYYCEDP